MAKEDKKAAIKGNEEELHTLFRETLDGLRDDLIEASENAQLYLDAITSEPGGKELYGSHYNDALKIKGSARDRTLKFLGLYKDRVSKKEDMATKANERTGSEFAIDHSDLNDLVAKIKESKGETVKPFISNEEIDIPIRTSIPITPIRRDVDLSEDDEEDLDYIENYDEDDDSENDYNIEDE